MLVEAVVRLEYDEPTPIQKEAIPHLLKGKDVLGLAATGTGKTAAFSLPLLAKLTPGSGKPFLPRALVLLPTRELALQVTEAMNQYGQAAGFRVVPVFGGQDIGQQLRHLKRGVDVVVATPGRALDHLERKSLLFDNIEFVVLDEADEMLDMGFAEDLEAILSKMPEKRQTALFSATMPPRITRMVDRFLKSPVKVSISKPKALPGEAPKVRQVAYVVPRPLKVAALMRILQLENAPSTLVFCRTRSEVDELTSTLLDLGIRSEALHGGLQQNQRDRVMRSFKAQGSAVLVATDVAARGLHIDNLAQVINYDVPNSSETYVHRVGRTGRAGREGVAITFVEPRELRLLEACERAAQAKIAVLDVPSPQELDQKRNARIRLEVEEALVPEENRSFSEWLSGLSAQEVKTVALQALEVLKASRFPKTELDIAVVPPFRKEKKPFSAKAEKTGRATEKPFERKPFEKKPFEKKAFEKKPFDKGAQRAPAGGEASARLFIGAGTAAGIRPGDLVGAIANETGLPSRQIGPIEIKDRFSLVSVPARAAEEVIAALRASSIRGRKVQVRRDTGAKPG